MNAHKGKLELTWVGKDERVRLEPRVLVEDSNKSHGNPKDDNMLIYGDNLLALKALEQDFAGKVKCVFIDPPYNTGSAFTHYDDGIEHSLWLNLIRDRLYIIQKLLTQDGTLWITIDDNECYYLKILCDEVFGRANFVTSIAWRSGDAPNNDAKQFSVDHNLILLYSKTPGWLSKPLPRTEEANAHYTNPDNDPNGPWFQGNLSSPHPRKNLQFDIVSPTGHIIKPPANGWRWSRESMEEKIASGEIIFTKEGTRLLRKTYLKNQKGLAPSSLWDNIEETGHNRQAKYELKKLFPDIPTSELFATPKPERLLKMVFQIATFPGDLVLDSFAGSGTTGAVAHKMGRRWIMCELGEHCHTHIIPRMEKVIDGTDQGGISEAVGWKGGGGFKYYRLAESLLVRDKELSTKNHPVYIINPKYDEKTLIKAICKIENFRYRNEGRLHGISSESRFLHVTTRLINQAYLDSLAEDISKTQSLLIYCTKRVKGLNMPENVELKKIPRDLLEKCDFEEGK